MKERITALRRQKPPDGQGPVRDVVEGAVDEPDDLRPMTENLAEFAKHLLEVLVPEPLFRRRQAVAAGEGTAPRTLIIDMAMPQVQAEVFVAIGGNRAVPPGRTRQEGKATA